MKFSNFKVSKRVEKRKSKNRKFIGNTTTKKLENNLEKLMIQGSKLDVVNI